MRRSALVTAAGLAIAAVLPALPAAAEEPITIELVSGGGPVGTTDPYTDISIDGGETYQDATVVTPHFYYDVLPGTAWISDSWSGLNSQVTALFRRSFALPRTATAAELTVCLHSDNAARVTLNGTLLGAQAEAEIFENFQNPAECFIGTPGSGDNVLEFAVRNFTGPMGLDYRATVTYVERVNTPPVLQLPDDVTADATGPDGAAVTFEATATDDTGTAEVVCEPQSGSTFAIGATTVTCTATDADGASITGSFTVTVRGAGELLADLLAAVTGVGPGRSLEAKIRTAIEGLADLSLPTTCDALAGFTSEVRAQSGRHVPEATATQFVADAARIRAVVDCE
jgi:hypothetical protein